MARSTQTLERSVDELFLRDQSQTKQKLRPHAASRSGSWWLRAAWGGETTYTCTVPSMQSAIHPSRFQILWLSLTKFNSHTHNHKLCCANAHTYNHVGLKHQQAINEYQQCAPVLHTSLPGCGGTDGIGPAPWTPAPWRTLSVPLRVSERRPVRGARATWLERPPGSDPKPRRPRSWPPASCRRR